MMSYGTDWTMFWTSIMALEVAGPDFVDSDKYVL